MQKTPSQNLPTQVNNRNTRARCEIQEYNSVKSVRIWSYSPYFLALGLNNERYEHQSRKIQTRITPNTDTFQVVYMGQKKTILAHLCSDFNYIAKSCQISTL